MAHIEELLLEKLSLKIFLAFFFRHDSIAILPFRSSQTSVMMLVGREMHK